MNINKWSPSQRERLAAGLCLQCGQLPVSQPHRICLACRRTKRKQRRILYDRRLSKGLCPVCGRKRNPDDLFYCTRCRERQKLTGIKNFDIVKERKYARRRRAKLRRQGLCTSCGQNRDNRKFLQCERCRKRQRDNYEKRRKLVHSVA